MLRRKNLEKFDYSVLDSVLANLVHDYPNHSTCWYANAAGIAPGEARRNLARLARMGHIEWRRFAWRFNYVNYWGTEKGALDYHLLSYPETAVEWAS